MLWFEVLWHQARYHGWVAKSLISSGWNHGRGFWEYIEVWGIIWGEQMSHKHREVVGVGGISCVLSVLILLWSKVIDNYKSCLALVLSCFFWMQLEFVAISGFYIIVPNITYIWPHPLHWNETPHHVPRIECACIPWLSARNIQNHPPVPIANIWHPTHCGSRYVTISSTSSITLPHFISVKTSIDCMIQMQKNDSNCSFWMSWFDFAGTPCLDFKSEPLNTFESIGNSIPTSAKYISIWVEWLHQSACAPSELWEKPCWRITPCPASIPRVALHIVLRLQFHSFFLHCLSPFWMNTLALWPPVTIRQNGCIGYTLGLGLQCDGWFWQNLSSRSFYLCATCHSLFTIYTHHSKSPDLCGYWQSIARSIRLLYYY